METFQIFLQETQRGFEANKPFPGCRPGMADGVKKGMIPPLGQDAKGGHVRVERYPESFQKFHFSKPSG